MSRTSCDLLILAVTSFWESRRSHDCGSRVWLERPVDETEVFVVMLNHIVSEDREILEERDTLEPTCSIISMLTKTSN